MQINRSEPRPNPKFANIPTEDLLVEYHKNRSLAVRDEIACRHYRLVIYLANRLAGPVQVEDAIQVGHMGLLGAIDRFNPYSGNRFVTFATPTIVGVIKRDFRDHGWLIKVPRRLQEVGLKSGKRRDELAQEYGREPTRAEMAQSYHLSEEEMAEVEELEFAYRPASLDVRSESGTSYSDRVDNDVPVVEQGFERFERREVTTKAIARLEERQRRVIQMRYFDQLSQSEIARRLGCSQMQVSRLERQALLAMRAYFGQ